MSERRIGLLLITHGGAGRELLAAANLLVADGLAPCDALTIAIGEVREVVAAAVADAAARLDEGAGVLMLCDLHGATPANCALALKHAGHNVEVLCGLSLPMLLKAATAPRTDSTVAALARLAAATAVRSVRFADGTPHDRTTNDGSTP
ncbi:MAG: PTS fructose transporter subunit IIA [Myxococcales bacterium]|nr:PTS fructose transporter subunit IIA [Myxococcales bacterium]